MSHPAWGAWIEILGCAQPFLPAARRTPHGVRGLKFTVALVQLILHESHPAWGAWIEIAQEPIQVASRAGRTPHGVRGLKLTKAEAADWRRGSHPAWGAWIEMHHAACKERNRIVAPRMGCVD